ncbi:hypothetical protein Ade02nite_88380 [Paractinoplanes deccanensis]|uniref:Uncharacterized protein n=1 Tax=Paractinoplanes deccanensis TaxID=113561 RepID=A0ABQ3YJQ5_9ACTN|nr:AfsR/SARP family transcriptional regulator [Actinoplanes deccanensis]GID80197.1 hypothetical protein Ade02nite_88380 [Actinoplanes deccanensis]
MKFGVLGPYLIQPDRKHGIRAAKHRSLLAVLTVNANSFVTVRRLTEELWLDAPPGSADNLVRQYVSAIRRELRDESLATLPGGYRLDLRDGDLDRDDFDRHLARARREIAEDRLESGSAELTAALSLWRGDPLGDVEQGPSITAEARRLVERRLSAIEQRIDVDLRRNRYGRALDEMAALVTLHPEREGLRARQMRALSATGRRADALAAFREGRAALVDGIGIEPGPELQRLHRQILSGDLPVESRPTTGPSQRAGPAQLPPDLPDLIARDEELAAIVGYLTTTGATAPVVVVSGKVGVGKSALVTHAGHVLRDRFPDGQLFLPLTGRTPADALRDALRALGSLAASAKISLRELREAYGRELRDRRVLVIADDATAESDVRALVPPGARSALLVTSRSVLPGIEGARHVPCLPLTEANAVSMLSGIIGEQRAAADPAGVLSLVTRLGRLPLAMRIAGSRLLVHPGRSVRLLSERLRRYNSLDELAYGGLAIRPRLAESMRQLTEAEQRVFRRAGVLSSFDVATAAQLAGLTVEQGAHAVDRLLELHLVDPADDGLATIERYATDLLARQYARERLAADDPRWTV